MKRLFDIFFSLLGLVILLPLFITVAILIKLTDKGTVFYRQERIGREFRPFYIYKFRSMRPDSSERSPLITVCGDDRITRIGRFLRKTKIDELPQLINVLKGDMSLVGPRPEVEKYVDLYRSDYEKILTIRPGITDPASIKYYDEETELSLSPEWEEDYIKRILPEKIRLASGYVDNHGIFLDIKLILKTVFNAKGSMSRFGQSWRQNLIFLLDMIIIAFCYIAAYFMRFDGVPDAEHRTIMFKLLPLVLAARVSALFYFKLHKCAWQYASIKDLAQIIKAVTLSSVFIAAVVMALQLGHPRSIFIIDWLLLVVILGGVRFFIRITRPIRWKLENGNDRQKRVLVVGAGDAGEMILRDMIYRYDNNYKVVGLIDDDVRKYNSRIHGVTVLGARSDIPKIVKENTVEEIIIAIPSLKSYQMREIVNYCIQSGAKYRTVPRMADLVNGTVKVKELREIKLEDLLRRDEVQIDRQKLKNYIEGKSVLITGAGGSIGSELCRQIAALSPGKLVLFEKSENALFYIDMELSQKSPKSDIVPVIGDSCDRMRVKQVFAEHKPQIIFHAAAHKHVPLMEANPMEAIKNNVFGTKTLAEEAMNIGAEKFIMLSTDKTVDPTSYMGVSKKVAEMYITALAAEYGTKFICVRFGNVLGSEGSAIPTFKKQIEKGGPVTITHPDIKRYFMTIPEAAGLVVEAGFMGNGGEIFILEMGTQLKIVDIARSLIKLSGLEPDKDIEIVFTGLRPGEKMYEALVADDEKLEKTRHERMMIVKPSRVNGRNIFNDINFLADLVEKECINTLTEKLTRIVPNYKPNMAVSQAMLEESSRVSDKDILIADDENIVQELLQKFLDGKGYITHLASNGRKALDIVRGSDVRVAFVDIKMPGTMDGFKVLRRIKRTNKDVKVILMTGFGTEKTKELSSRLGAYAYIEKPLDLVDVRKHVEDALTV